MPNTLTGVEQFVSLGTASVIAGGNSAPPAGTQETWTLGGSSLPAASSTAPTTFFYIGDTTPGFASEVIAVKNISGSTATVIRGADGTTPIAHTTSPFSVIQVSAGASMRGLLPYGLNAVRQFGADPTGVADSTSAIQAAVTAAIALGGGVVVLEPGTYKVSSTITASTGGVAVYIQGAGRFATTVNFTGTGDCFRMFSTAGNFPANAGGGIRGLAINGSGAGAGSAGIHAGDIFQLELDVAVTGFTGAGSIGVHLDNATFWTEQTLARIYVNNCTTGVVFDVSGATTSTGSYERGVFDINCNMAATQNGVVFQNGAFLMDGRLSIYGNFATSASSQGGAAVLTLTGSAPGGHPASNSAIQSCALNIGCETDGGLANKHQTIILAGGSNNVTQCSGVIDFNLGNGFAVASLAGGWQFFGPVNGDSTLVRQSIFGRTDLGAIANNANISPFGAAVVSVSPAGAVTGITISAGSASRDGQQITIINTSAFTVTFAAAGTSHVADGVADVIAATTARTFTWDNGAALWYRSA